MSEVRIGGVTARFNEDGTLYIYQPDSNRALSSELAGDLVDWLVLNYGPMQTAADGEWRAPKTGWYSPTVPAGVINTSDGAKATLDAMAQDVADVADTEAANTFVDTRPVRLENPTQKQMAEVAAELGLPTYGTKTQLSVRLMKAGVEIVTG